MKRVVLLSLFILLIGFVSALPDLTPTNLTISSPKDYYLKTDSLNLGVTVKNLGTTAIQPGEQIWNITWYLDGNKIKESEQSYAPLGEDTAFGDNLYLSKIGKTGNLTLRVIVDEQNVIDETNDENNEIELTLEVKEESPYSCTDSDGGQKIYTFGESRSTDGSFHQDICIISDSLNSPETTTDSCEGSDCWIRESVCSRGEATYLKIRCGGKGCKDGVCIGEVTCSDSDNGADYFTKGSVTVNRNGEVDIFNDECMGENNVLLEYSCKSNEPSPIEETHQCPFGCVDEKCLKAEPTDETGPIDLPKNTTETQEIICNGCALENKCYPLGYRKSGKYCSDNNQFIDYKTSKVSCDNNFECSSNVCVNSECISERLIQRILDWFKKLFGG